MSCTNGITATPRWVHRTPPHVEEVEVVRLELGRVIAIVGDAELPEDTPCIGALERDVEVEAGGSPGVREMHGLISSADAQAWLRRCRCCRD
jgi:hypothetical protein